MGLSLASELRLALERRVLITLALNMVLADTLTVRVNLGVGEVEEETEELRERLTVPVRETVAAALRERVALEQRVELTLAVELLLALGLLLASELRLALERRLVALKSMLREGRAEEVGGCARAIGQGASRRAAAAGAPLCRSRRALRADAERAPTVTEMPGMGGGRAGGRSQQRARRARARAIAAGWVE